MLRHELRPDTLARQPCTRLQHGSNEMLAKSLSAELRVSYIGLKQMERLLIRRLQLLQLLCALSRDVMGIIMYCLQKEHTREFRRPSLTSSTSVSFELLSPLERQKKDNINLFSLLFNFHRTVTNSVHLKFRHINNAN